ncbi:hypothetical protein LEL_09906 [Akanthomyces lecanii RCEF 1005]|uniref:Uncharacterized protein n=1 Tax=Akanthomyces lecanii RCEF 1005 TaxID=1081108 RepID=A0A168BGL2_CORDF|nr:hypothetical protein LEL_09906 [Akanthomyces lecanii RCEF 1005]
MPSYVLTGRGGAGNTHRLAPSSSSSPSTTKKPVAASTTSSSSTPRIVSSGVGGAGNMRALDAGARSSAAHALQQDMRRYAGRGGAGNAYAYAGSSASDADDDASLLSGSSAASSVAERARGWASRVSGSFSRS